MPVAAPKSPLQTLPAARRRDVVEQLHDLVDDAGLDLDEQLRIEAAIAAAHAGGVAARRRPAGGSNPISRAAAAADLHRRR